jgi:hypothetical protein
MLLASNSRSSSRKPIAASQSLVAESHQVALVGKQRMRLRMRRDHHGVGEIGRTQRRACCGSAREKSVSRL